MWHMHISGLTFFSVAKHQKMENKTGGGQDSAR